MIIYTIFRAIGNRSGLRVRGRDFTGAVTPNEMIPAVIRRSSRLQSVSIAPSAESSQQIATVSTGKKRTTKGITAENNKKRQKVPQPSEVAVNSEVFEIEQADSALLTSPTTINTENCTAAGPKTPARTPRKRTAAVQKTNAPLQTPGGTRLVRIPTAAALTDLSNTTTSPTHTSPSVGTTTLTTENLLDTAEAHLISVDPTLKPWIEQFHCKMLDPEGLAEPCEPFAALASGIMGQQVSGAAAKSIRNKFVALFPDIETANGDFGGSLTSARERFPTPAMVVTRDLATLRTAGLSQRKAEYIHGLAERFVSGELSAQMLINASDEEVLEKLIAVRGLGRWSVEMFACFGLKRTDIFSTGDLGIQRGMAAHKGRDVAKLKNKGGKWKYMSEAEMIEMAAPFSP